MSVLSPDGVRLQAEVRPLQGLRHGLLLRQVRVALHLQKEVVNAGAEYGP